MAAKRKKNAPKNSKLKKRVIAAVVLVVMLSVMVYIAFNYERLFVGEIIASVNGETITEEELEAAYTNLPEQYKLIVTKNDLLEQMVNEKLLLQEAAKQGIKAAKEEIDGAINSFAASSNLESSEFADELKKQGLSMKDLQGFYEKSIIISKLLNDTVDPKIYISEKEVEVFYDNNKETIGQQNPDAQFEDVKQQIRDYLFSKKQAELLEEYLKELKSKAAIKVDKFGTFTVTGDYVCTKYDKPIIRLFTSKNCKSCDWVQNAFDLVALDYITKGKIIAYHWVLDEGDDRLTDGVGTAIPKSEIELFQKYNPKSTVPTFIFGCKYVRIGNGYEEEGNVNLEKEEFKAIIDELIS